MAVFEVVIQQNVRSDIMTNVYHVNESTLDLAYTTANQIAIIHAGALTTDSTVTALRVATPAQRDGVFATEALSIGGSRPFTGDALPRFNRFMVSFDMGFTFRCRKFFPDVHEGDQLNGYVLNETKLLFKNLYIDPLVELGSVCNIHGVIIKGGAVVPPVAMRQLRRARKRKTPVI